MARIQKTRRKKETGKRVEVLRNIEVAMLLKSDEYDRIRLMTEEGGFASIADCLRYHTFGKSSVIKKPNAKERVKLIGQINSIGNNLNQIARKVNEYAKSHGIENIDMDPVTSITFQNLQVFEKIVGKAIKSLG